MRISVLGPVTAEAPAGPVALGGPRQRAVLALLVAARGGAVPAERMVEDLWDSAPPARAMISLQSYVSNLRKILEPDRPPRTPARVLVNAPPGYALRLPAEAVDAWRFTDLVAEARTAADPRPLLREALGLWRGPAFAEAADRPWAQPEINRLRELRLAAREMEVAARLRAGEPAVPEAERLTLDEPLREEGWRLYALALWGDRRQAEALAALRRARSVLAEELGLDPGPELAELEDAILNQRMEVLEAARPAGPPDAPPARSVPPVPAPPAELFVGRDAELAALRAAAEQGRVALVTGEAGLGKTALLDRLAADLAAGGALVAYGRCPEADGAPPAWAWTEALRAVAAAVPPPPEADALLADRPRPAADAAAGRFRLHRAVWEWLAEAARRRPLVVVLDDLHWADAETLALLTAGDAPIALVLAFRGDEAAALSGALAALARRSPLRLALPGLPGPAVARLVAAECEAPVDAATVAALAERTGGNPFYVRESARLLNGEGTLSDVPEGVRDVLRRRLARLSEPAVAVLRLAALAGREVPVEPLVEASDTDEDGVLDALDAGVGAGLLTEPAPGRVRFAHALVRDTLVADLSALRRTRMHARLAAALERLSPDEIPLLAHHYAHAASAATAAKAVDYSVRAAALARDRYAHDAAVALLRQAVAALERVPGRPGLLDLLAELLRAQIRAGDVTAARETRRRAVELAEGDDDLLLAAFTAWTELTPWQVREYGKVDERVVAHLARLLERPDLSPRDRCLLLNAYAAELTGEGDPTAQAAAEEAADLARSLGDPGLRALTSGTLARELNRPGGGAQEALGRELVALGTEHDLPAALWAGTFNLAAAAVRRNDAEAARRFVHEALELARRYRMADATLVGECSVAALAHVEGRAEEAERRYAAAAEAMTRQGSLHGQGFLLLVRAVLAATGGRLAALADDPAYASLGPMGADVTAAALAAAGRLEEARRVHALAEPIRPNYFLTLFAAFRAMTVVALEDREAAEELYGQLLPFSGGPPAGLESLSAAMPPVDRTLGELARLLGRDPEQHFARAREVAARWAAP
ncbi:BTAD domain-containing putative transcriptional regulator [Spirillospora sp. NPDC050679]